MATAFCRLLGTPVLVNEAGILMGVDVSARAPIAAPRLASKATTTPSVSPKRLPGTPCYVTASGAIVTSPFAHQSGLKRLLGTPCFVTETGEIVGSSHSVQVEHPNSVFKTNTTRRPAAPSRLLGTPCFVTGSREIVGPDQRATRPSGPGRLVGTPSIVSEDGHFVDSTALPVAAPVAVPVLQELESGFNPVHKFPFVLVGNVGEDQKKRSLIVEMEAQIAELKRQIRELSV